MASQARVPHLGHYIRVLVLVTCAVNLGAVLLAMWSPVRIPAGTLAMIPPVIGAVSVGRAWVRETAQVPVGRQAWLWSVIAAMAYLTIQVLLLPLALMHLEMTPDLLRMLVTVLAAAALLAVPLHRFFLSLGARSVWQGS